MKPKVRLLMYAILAVMLALSFIVFSSGSQFQIGLLLVLGTPFVVFAIAALLLDRADLEPPKKPKKAHRK